MLKKLFFSLTLLSSLCSCEHYREKYSYPYKIYLPDNANASESIAALKSKDIKYDGKVFKIVSIEYSVIHEDAIVLLLEEQK